MCRGRPPSPGARMGMLSGFFRLRASCPLFGPRDSWWVASRRSQADLVVRCLGASLRGGIASETDLCCHAIPASGRGVGVHRSWLLQRFPTTVSPHARLSLGQSAASLVGANPGLRAMEPRQLIAAFGAQGLLLASGAASQSVGARQRSFRMLRCTRPAKRFPSLGGEHHRQGHSLRSGQDRIVLGDRFVPRCTLAA